MSEQPLVVNGIQVPRFLYGTAWKEEQTQRLTALALQQGFRGIDTANQRKHYHEAGVGQALASYFASGFVSRKDVFLQTKFTFRAVQDDRLPYNADAPIATQVEQSFASSLEHLGVEAIDSYMLHGPSRRSGLATDDWDAWHAMETIYDSGRAKLLGISNVTVEQLQLLLKKARIKPCFVQNRCYASQGWDYRVRQLCAANGVIYQGFSLLTANRDVLSHSQVAQIAKRHNRQASQVVFRFALDIGMLPLTGTSDTSHMKDDLAVLDFRLDDAEVKLIEKLMVR